MTSTPPRAVLTGIGVLTPLGLGIDAFWEGMLKGQSGVKSVQAFDTSGLPTKIAGEIQDFDAKSYIDRKERKSLKVMARPIQMAVAASSLAIQDACLDTSKLDPLRFGIEFGAGLIASELDELGPASQLSANCKPGEVDLRKWGEKSIPAMTPLWMLKYLPNMLACHVSILHNAQGPNNTITETDVAALLAMGEAYQIIRRGLADVMLTGSADSKVNPLSMTRMSLFLPLSKRNDAPEKACRPFDRHRDGIVPGEGGGILIMEELEHARKRGARIYAEVVGFDSSFDLRRNGDGLARAITGALKKANITPSQLDHVNAQGFSTLREDTWESRGIYKALGGAHRKVPVFAAKSYTGSMGSASGGIELSVSLRAMQQGILPPTLNFEELDPECAPITVAAGQPRPVESEYFLKISFTEMGQCAALVLRKWSE